MVSREVFAKTIPYLVDLAYKGHSAYLCGTIRAWLAVGSHFLSV